MSEMVNDDKNSLCKNCKRYGNCQCFCPVGKTCSDFIDKKTPNICESCIHYGVWKCACDGVHCNKYEKKLDEEEQRFIHNVNRIRHKNNKNETKILEKILNVLKEMKEDNFRIYGAIIDVKSKLSDIKSAIEYNH